MLMEQEIASPRERVAEQPKAAQLLVWRFDKSSASWFRSLGVHSVSMRTPRISACAASSICRCARWEPGCHQLSVSCC